jgi:adenine nucleotide transporter 17
MSVALGHALAGVIGGVASTTVTYPLLVTTVRLQTARKNATTKGQPVEGYENTLAAFKTILGEGYKSLYAGYQSAFIGTAYSNFIYYYLYQFLNELATLVTKHKPLHLLDNILVAALSGSATAVASNPIWVLNTRMSVEAKAGSEKSLLKTATEMVQKEGFRSLFAGVLPALVLVSNPVINYVLFERIQLALKAKRLTPWQLFFVGCFTKLIAAFVTHPYLVIKTRMQANQDDANQSISQVLKGIFAEDGIRGLFSGLSTKLVHSVLTSALLFLIKDQSTAASIKLLTILGIIKISKRGAVPA